MVGYLRLLITDSILVVLAGMISISSDLIFDREFSDFNLIWFCFDMVLTRGLDQVSFGLVYTYTTKRYNFLYNKNEQNLIRKQMLACRHRYQSMIIRT